MAEWIYVIHPPRENFADTMTDVEKAVWSVHFASFERLLAEGVIILGRSHARPPQHRDHYLRSAR